MTHLTRRILASNLYRLMHANSDKPISQAELHRLSHVDQRYIGRILKAEVSTSIDILEKLAKPFDLSAWQLLIPDLDPSNPPVNHMTEVEKSLYERLKEAASNLLEQQHAPYRK